MVVLVYTYGMKKNIKIIVVILVVFIIVSGVIYYQKNKKIPLVNNNNLVAPIESVLGTYVANLSKDVYTLKISSQEGESIKGELDINNFEKDSSNGTLVGTYKDGIILADYTFKSEGTISINQVIFKKTVDGFVRGYGDVDKATGTHFVDLNAITYDSSVVYKKVSPNVEKTPVNTTVQGKLNINLVCENSLSYMKFKDSVSADKFVMECKNGEHPEVIEHYKAELNLGEGVKI
jgi:hypothetical protein